jgi:D,D-heptose 1,7-bisphosphate phosphatase
VNGPAPLDSASKQAVPSPRVRQAVILVGGKGARLGHFTSLTPKPLMIIDGNRVFLDLLIENIARQGFDRILLLAGHYGIQIAERFDKRTISGAAVTVTIEAEPLGTGGALKRIRERLDPMFLLANGDTYFDIRYRALEVALNAAPDALAAMALRELDDASRYGSVELEGARIRRFREKVTTEKAGPGPINGGVYLLRRDAIDALPEGASSLETLLFPLLASEGRLIAQRCVGYFIDIGSPEALALARAELPSIIRRPALFLDRDGVINADRGYVHHWSRWDPTKGVASVVQAFNEAGWLVFVITNQAGVAHGYYDEGAVRLLHDQISDWLAAEGAHIDAYYYCPYHAEAAIEAYRADHPDRKPRGGMLLRALSEWPVAAECSFLVGDRPSDLAAGRAAGIRSYLFEGNDLTAFFSAHDLWPSSVRSGESSCYG